MRAFVELMIRRRAWVLALCAALTLLGGWSLSGAVIATSLGKMFLGEDPRFERYQELIARFGNDEVVAIGIEDPASLSLASQERLAAAVAEVRSLTGVQRVRSVLDAVYLQPGMFAGAEAELRSATPLASTSRPPGAARPRAGWSFPLPVRYADEARREPGRAEELLARLGKDPIVSGLLLSKDARATAVLVELDPAATSSAEGIPALVGAVTGPFRSRFPPGAVHQAGMPCLVAETLRQTILALVVCTPVVSLVLLLTVWALFGRLWPAAVSLGVAAVAMVWTLGVAVQLDPQLNIMMSFVPAVILIISFSDIVHLCSAYLIELGAGLEREEAIVAACSEVGRACLFTSLTTFVGFVCLSLIPVPVFRVLGVVLGLGVGVALLLAVTLVPIVLSLLPTPAPLRTVTGEGERIPVTERVQALLDLVLARSERLAVLHPRAVHWGFLLATGLALFGARDLTIETDFVERLTAKNPVRQDQEWFLSHFLAADALQVYVHAPSPAALEDPAWLAKLAALQAATVRLEEVEGARSVLDVLAMVDQALPGATPGGGPPREPARVQAIYRLLARQPDLRALVDRERGTVRLLVHPRGTGMRTASRVAAEVERLGAELLAGAGRVEASGLLPLFGGFLDQVVRAQRDGLLVSILTIAALMAIGVRSLRVGVTSMLPNLFPLIVLAGLLGALFKSVDSDTIALTFLALGIGVDDTIHFLSRYRLEVARGGSTSEAIGRTFTFAGRGIVMTTVILSCGFIPFLISDYYFMRMIGSLLPLCFVVALLADLLWVPALAQLGWLRYAPPSEAPGGTP
ncbi:MAG: RND family transporter [Planctomycetota bacterium]